MVRPTSTSPSTAMCEGGCAASSDAKPNEKAGLEVSINADGPILTSPRLACSPYDKRTLRLADLLESNPPTGGPDAGNPPVRLGGRGKAHLCPSPYLSPG